jgi:uncharacterized lipoprotein YajG
MDQFALCILLFASLSGCALTTDEVSLDYHSVTHQNEITGARAIRVQVTASDGRAPNRDKVSVKKNGYGMEMGSIISTQSLPDLLKAAVQQELAKKGFQIGSGSVLVNVELNKFYNDFKMGFVTADAVSEVTITAQVITLNGRILYARNVTGDANEGGVMLANGSNAKLSLEKALSTCVDHLVNDPNFTQAILTASRARQSGIS